LALFNSLSRRLSRGLALGAGLLAGVMSQAQAADEAIYDGNDTVAIIGYSGTVTRWNNIDFPNFEKWMKVYAPNVTVKRYDPRADAATEVTMAKSAIVSGAKVLALAAFQDDPSAILEAAKEADVKVVLYIFVPKSVVPGVVSGIVGTDPVAVGEAQAKYMLEKLPEGGKLAIVNGDMSSSYGIQQNQGMMNILKPAVDAGKIKIVAERATPGFQTAPAEQHVSSILTSLNNDVDGFIMGNDDMAQGAISAIRHAGVTDKKIVLVGQDGSVPAVRSMLQGEPIGSAYRNLFEESRGLAEATAYALAGKEPPAGFYDKSLTIGDQTLPFRATPVTVVDRSNLDTEVKDGAVTVEEICKDLDPAKVGEPCK
jgi:D-xylose transport system substrate-binding protein